MDEVQEFLNRVRNKIVAQMEEVGIKSKRKLNLQAGLSDHAINRFLNNPDADIELGTLIKLTKPLKTTLAILLELDDRAKADAEHSAKLDTLIQRSDEMKDHLARIESGQQRGKSNSRKS